MSTMEHDKKMATTSGFMFNNKFELVDIEEGVRATVKAPITENSLNPYGIAHGGFIFGLGDTAMGVAARSTDRRVVTLNSNISYLKPALGEYLVAKSEIVKNGKTICYLKCNIYNDVDDLVASMDGNYYYID